jgi:hypothetical protein
MVRIKMHDALLDRVTSTSADIPRWITEHIDHPEDEDSTQPLFAACRDDDDSPANDIDE